MDQHLRPVEDRRERLRPERLATSPIVEDCLPVGDTFEKGQEFGTLESTKSVSPLFMPVAGTVKAVNEALVDAPEKVNQDPYGEGWLIEIESAEGVSELLDAAAYKAHLETL